MADHVVEHLHSWISEHEHEMLDVYRQLLQIPSIEGEAAPGAPFGIENRRALDMMLEHCHLSDMRTKDLDGYIGYGEFGSGDRLIAAFGHLDVVPVGPGWKHEPFGAEIDGEYVYARGAVDDKGPTVAAFFAARAVQAVVPDVAARIRVVFGCNEESGFKCIEHYVEHDEAPTFGFAPDAGWPLIHAEKGIANLIVTRPLPKGGLSLISIEGGQRPNIVIDSCKAVAEVSPSVRSEVESKLADSWDKNLTFRFDGSRLEIEAIGKAAHGSWPHGGDNAATRILRFLMEISPVEDKATYETLFEVPHIGGAGVGIAGADIPSRDLTCNLGIIQTKDGEIVFTLNVRYPVTWSGTHDVREKCEEFLSRLEGGYKLADFHDSNPLYFPLDHPLVSTICDVVKLETGDTTAPGVMGGGTYARAVPNTVAIGTGWMGDGDAHQTDERLAIKSLYKMARIYAHLFYRLVTAPTP